MNTAAGPRPARLAKELEDRGFESWWVPEHGHIPTSRATPHPSTNPLPSGYLHMMNPFVSLAAASAVTEKLILGTAVSLILQHDVVDLATEVASLDVISEGRLVLGIGVGWNREELADHRPDLAFKLRYRAQEERVAALRQLWTDSEAGFEGRWDKVSPCWLFPKPTNGTVPISLGNWGPIGLQHAARYADEWMPVDAYLRDADGKPDPAGAIAHFRHLVEQAGRDPDSVPVSILLFSRPTPSRLERYAAAGVKRVVASAPTAELVDADFIMRDVDEITPIMQDYYKG